MNKSNLEYAKQYYDWIVKKDLNNINNLLHDAIEFVGPMCAIKGKAEVFSAISGYANIVENIEIIENFSNADKVMLTYILTFQKQKSRAAVMLTFTNNLIKKLDLYYDPTPFLNMRNDIFRDE